MKYALFFLWLFFSLQTYAAAESLQCVHWPAWSKHACTRLHQIWSQGSTELYVTGYAWHNRFIYDPERISRYNEAAWGGGFGKGYYDEDGDWHALAAFAFLDSHKNVEPAGGYAFVKIMNLNENARLGGGFSVLVTQRPDILHGIPFPGVLPWVLVNYRRATVCATYIPGSHNVGNVVFVLAKWTF